MSSQSSGSEQEKSHEQFIEAVRKQEVLYKADHENYRDKNLRQKAWEKVVAECGMISTVEDAKNRWKYLRDSFTDSHKKQIRQNWRYRKQMEFLLPYIGLRRRKVDKLNKGNDVVDLTADEPDLINQNDFSQFVEATLDDEHQSAVNGGSIIINEKQPNKFELCPQIPIFTQKDEHQKVVIENTVKNSKSSKDYELYKFFMVMYKEVLQFPDRKKVDVKKRIFKVVAAEELNTTKENGFRKRSLDVTSNNSPIRKSKRSSSAPNTTKASKQLSTHSKNKEYHISSNCILPKTNSSVTNLSSTFLNELNSLPKPSTSFTAINVLSNQANVERKSKELKSDVITFSPRENTKTISFPNQLHNELLQQIGSQSSIKLPKTLSTNNTSIISHQSFPKISSAITMSPDAFSEEKSELHPILTVPSLPILNNTNVSTTLAISNVIHIGELRDNEFENNLNSPQAGCSTLKNKNTYSNKLLSIETSQNKDVEFSSKNVPSKEVSSTSTLSSISVTSDKKVDQQNVKKELDSQTMNAMHTAVISTNSVTLENFDNKSEDKKDEHLLSLSAASCTDVAEIVLSDENE